MAGLDIDVRGSGPLTAAVGLGTCSQWRERHRLARLTRHGELVAQRAAPIDQDWPRPLELPPGAFLQATAEGEAALARHVVSHLGSGEDGG